jgi:hypothetical protein
MDVAQVGAGTTRTRALYQRLRSDGQISAHCENSVDNGPRSSKMRPGPWAVHALALVG